MEKVNNLCLVCGFIAIHLSLEVSETRNKEEKAFKIEKSKKNHLKFKDYEA